MDFAGRRSSRSMALMNARVMVAISASSRPPEGRSADAILLRDGAIAAVGSQDRIRNIASAGTRFVDLQGRVVVPGFIDAHMHPIFYGLSLQGVPCLPPLVSSIADLKREVAEHVSRAPAGGWIWGQGYDDTRLAESRHPSRHDLDEVSPHHPVALTRVCGHMCVANSRALELAGVDASTPDPPGGRIERDASGEPTGLLLETAEDLVLRRIPREHRDILQALGRVSDELLRNGITSCCDACLGYTEGAAEYDIWAEAIRSRLFRPRISFLAGINLWRATRDRPDAASGLDILGVKLFTDGSISGGSAGLREPFLEESDRRLFVYDPDELAAICTEVHTSGLALAIHAMGDRAISMTLDGIERARTGEAPPGPTAAGHPPVDRIEHCTLPSRSDIDRMARLDVMPVTQPIFLFAEGEAYLSKLGPARSLQANPVRAMVDSGVQVALGSDAPATTWGEPTDVMLSIQTAVLRRTWAGSSLGSEQGMTVEESLLGYTANAARACGFGGKLGVIEEGRPADLAVLSDDPTRVPPEEIRNIQVTNTFLAGEPVHGEL